MRHDFSSCEAGAAMSDEGGRPRPLPVRTYTGRSASPISTSPSTYTSFLVRPAFIALAQASKQGSRCCGISSLWSAAVSFDASVKLSALEYRRMTDSFPAVLSAAIDWLGNGLWDLTWWQVVLYTLVTTHITIAAV
ncbi:hypothetical protein QTI33_34925, partial [Variovorax sp. J22P271]|uniref:hypothetical protein n=1 Tax=Variovorax davisae TaxID=3053515 RepID=UPI0025779290